MGARASRFALLLLPAVFGCLLARPAAAMSEDERDATFWKVGVTDFAGKTQYLDGATAAVRFAVGLRDSKRFHVMAPNAVRRSVIQTGSDISRGELSEADAKKICRQLVIDGIFAGRIEPGANGYSSLTIALYAASGRLFAQYRFTVSPQLPVEEATRVALGYLTRFPYDGLVVSVRKEIALINLGGANGLHAGSHVFAYDMDQVTRDQGGTVTGGNQKPVAELEVVRAEQHGSWVRPVRGEMPAEFAKISLHPVPGTESLKVAEAKAYTAVPDIDLEAIGDLGLITKQYQLNGTGARFSSDTTVFPAPGIRVSWFPARDVGMYVAIRHGFIPFRRPLDNGNGGTSYQTYSGSIDHAEAQGEVRHTFGKSFLAGGSATAGLGLYYAAFQVDTQTPLVLTSDTYLGPIVSGELRAPVFLDGLTLSLRAGVIPYASLTQSPVNNGSGSCFGYQGTLGLDYHINERLFLGAYYTLDQMHASFPAAGGTRGIQSPNSTDVYHGLLISLGWRRYR